MHSQQPKESVISNYILLFSLSPLCLSIFLSSFFSCSFSGNRTSKIHSFYIFGLVSSWSYYSPSFALGVDLAIVSYIIFLQSINSLKQPMMTLNFSLFYLPCFEFKILQQAHVFGYLVRSWWLYGCRSFSAKGMNGVVWITRRWLDSTGALCFLSATMVWPATSCSYQQRLSQSNHDALSAGMEYILLLWMYSIRVTPFSLT